MSQELRRVVTFCCSRFNTSEQKPDFINECCYGDDVAVWLMSELRRSGYQTDDAPGQEDFGWYLNFQVDDVKHCIVIGYRPGDSDDEGVWIGCVERSRSFLESLFGRRRHGITSAAVNAIHHILTSDPTIRDVLWHFTHDFDAGREERGVAEPL